MNKKYLNSKNNFILNNKLKIKKHFWYRKENTGYPKIINS